MDTILARFESARLLSLGYLARTCLRRKAWTIYVQPTAWRTACKHCFMTCNTISLVQRLTWKRFRWNFIDTFEDVCSLHTCFSADSLHLLCCITLCESSGCFFWATRFYVQCYMHCIGQTMTAVPATVTLNNAPDYLTNGLYRTVG